MILAWFFIGAAILLVAYYLWFLTWPVVNGAVVQVDQGIIDISEMRSPRRYRMVRYEFSLDGQPHASSRQGLFVGAALGPRKRAGDSLRVSLCQQIPQLSCPFRPLFELVVLAGMVGLLLGVSAALWLL